MKRQKVLETAAKLIHGDRAKDYGDEYQNHQRIADGWNIIIVGILLEILSIMRILQSIL